MAKENQERFFGSRAKLQDFSSNSGRAVLANGKLVVSKTGLELNPGYLWLNSEWISWRIWEQKSVVGFLHSGHSKHLKHFKIAHK